MVRRRSLVLLIMADACWLAISIRLALAVDGWRRSLPERMEISHIGHVLAMVTLWLTALFICGAYDRRYLVLKGRNLSLTMFGSAMALGVLAGACYLVPAWHMSRSAFVTLGLVGGPGLVVIRTGWLAIDRSLCWPQFLGVGDPELLAIVWEEVSRALGVGRPLSVVASSREQGACTSPGVRLCSEETALHVLEQHGKNVVVLTDGTIPSPQAAYILSRASLTGCTVADVFTFYEMNTGRAPIFIVPGGWVFRAHHRAPEWTAYVCKRLFDLTVTLALLPLVIPIIAVAALLVRMTSSGPAFYRQRRVGYGGREFSLLKLRTMRVGADGEGSALWTQRDDPRITPVGRFLRATAIDELPQLWNVMCGDLSLVGPRPEQPDVIAELEHSMLPYAQRHVVPSGVTGWAQIHRGGDIRFDDVLDKIRLDLYYARNFSLWFDILILLRTFQMLLAVAKPAPAALLAQRVETARLHHAPDSPG
ncbi:MAG: sugar transferase [Armatimonadetes bacterium]|nr:sugar transferase [Armatimonadota bacterium]